MQKLLILFVACFNFMMVLAKPELLEIEKIVQNPVPVELKPSTSDSLLKTGTQIIIEMGTTLLPFDLYGATNKLNIIFGNSLNQHIFIGLGTGLRYGFSSKDWYYYNHEPSDVFNDFGVPLFFDFRVSFSIKKLKPFLLIDGGYSFDLEDNDPTSREVIYSMKNIRPVGSLFCPGAGLSFIYSEKYVLNIALIFEMQKHKEYPGWTHGVTNGKTLSSNGISLNLGLSF